MWSKSCILVCENVFYFTWLLQVNSLSKHRGKVQGRSDKTVGRELESGGDGETETG